MPYKSEAQRRFFNSPAAKEKGISQKTVDEFNAASKGAELPEKVSKKTGLDKLKDKIKKRMKDM